MFFIHVYKKLRVGHEPSTTEAYNNKDYEELELDNLKPFSNDGGKQKLCRSPYTVIEQ